MGRKPLDIEKIVMDLIMSDDPILKKKSAKKIFDIAQMFIGKIASQQFFEFMTWLIQYADRFQKAALYLEKIFAKETTTHQIILTPDTGLSFLNRVEKFFSKLGPINFIINRSVHSFHIPDGEDPFLSPMRNLKERENKLRAQLSKQFPNAPIESIPLMLMGEDTEEELLKFIKA